MDEMFKRLREIEEEIVREQFEQEYPDTCPGCFRAKSECRCGEGPCH